MSSWFTRCPKRPSHAAGDRQRERAAAGDRAKSGLTADRVQTANTPQLGGRFASGDQSLGGSCLAHLRRPPAKVEGSRSWEAEVLPGRDTGTEGLRRRTTIRPKQPFAAGGGYRRLHILTGQV
jgi:hypothetical protein